MADTWITDLNHFLNEDGDIISEPIPAKIFAEYFTAIVLLASFPESEYPPEYIVRCRRRPNRKPCNEGIVSFIVPESDEIFWICPKCNDRGSITNWRNSMWDLSDLEPVTH